MFVLEVETVIIGRGTVQSLEGTTSCGLDLLSRLCATWTSCDADNLCLEQDTKIVELCRKGDGNGGTSVDLEVCF